MLRRLLIGLAILGLLAAGVWWSNKKTAEEAAKPKPADPAMPQIVSIADSNLTEIRLKRGEMTTVLKKSAAGKWEMVAPQSYRVDSELVGAILGAIAPLNATQVIDEKPANLAPFGLDTPAAEAAFTSKDGKTRTISFGDDVPASGDVYARVDGDARVYSVSSSVRSSLDKQASDLRDKRLMTFDADKLTRLELTSKGQTIEFGKNAQGDWAILKPKPYRADGFQVDELIRRLKEAKMDSGDSSAAQTFAGGAPVATARATDQGGTQTFEVRKAKDDYYARSSVTEGVYKISADAGQGMVKTLDDCRNKKLFDFGFSDVTKLEVTRDGKTVVYAKSGEKWYAGAKAIDAASLQSLIDKARDLTASKFADRAVGTPAIGITATAKDGKLTDRVSIAKQGNDYVAWREGEPEGYLLESKAVEELAKAASAVKDASAETKK